MYFYLFRLLYFLYFKIHFIYTLLRNTLFSDNFFCLNTFDNFSELLRCIKCKWMRFNSCDCRKVRSLVDSEVSNRNQIIFLDKSRGNLKLQPYSRTKYISLVKISVFFCFCFFFFDSVTNSV